MKVKRGDGSDIVLVRQLDFLAMIFKEKTVNLLAMIALVAGFGV